MATIAIASFGTLGDMYPFFQLGTSLQQRGHRILLATSAIYRPKTEELGFTWFPLRPDLENLGATVDDLAKKLMDPNHGAEFLYKACIMPAIEQTYEDICILAEQADILITHPLVMAAPIAAAKKQFKWVSTVLAPISVMSAYDPPVLSISIFNKLKLGPKTAGRIISLIKKKLSKWSQPIDEFRASLGLPPALHPMFDGQHSGQLALALFSQTFGAAQPDWPPSLTATGFVFYEDSENAILEPALTHFLKAGPPPVVFTLGSSAVFNAGSFFEESIVAAKQLNCRAVILTGLRAGHNAADYLLPENIMVTDYVPHALLFQAAAVVVHHGGVGTTAQVMRAGIPSLVVPHAHDQPDNATRVKKMGISELVDAKKYKAKKIVPLLKKLLTDPTYRIKAKATAQAIAAEDGAQKACQLIEEMIN